MNLSRALALSCLLLFVETPLRECRADAIDDSVRVTLVRVTAEAVGDDSSKCPGCPLTSIATGFFVSSYGRLVTAHHLIGSLGAFDRATLHITVQPNPYSNDRLPAEIEYVDNAHDVLVLLVPRVREFAYMRSAPRDSVELSATEIFTSGFPEAYAYMTDTGRVKAFNGPEGAFYLWVTNMEFKGGQSGSPVYLADGGLIGLVKGSEAGFDKNSFIIPIEYVERLVKLDQQDGVGDVAAAPPVLLGTVRLIGVVSDRPVERVFKETDRSCGKGKSVEWRVAAQSGWRIDPATVSVKVLKATGGSQFKGVRDSGESGFTVTGNVTGFRDCRLAGFPPLARTGRGDLFVRVMYTERRADASEIEFARLPLRSGDTLTQPLPGGSGDVKVVLDSPDGKSTTQLGPGEQEAFTVELVDRKVSITAK